jgi:membrane protein YqaA with SNARE-associated domain
VHYPAWLLVLAASLGNTLGSAVNWGLGRLLARFEHQRWFPVRRATIARAEAWYHRYGRWSLLLSWLPVIGDPLTIVAGVLRKPFPVFLLLVAVAKTACYLAVIAIAQGWM